jgi:hypothetical protein
MGLHKNPAPQKGVGFFISRIQINLSREYFMYWFNKYQRERSSFLMNRLSKNLSETMI